ncbi:C45 family autoproteolytic acyltransferase/hydolase [Halobacillus litoralis]|uniref:C45 family autoproteolytic acyltransferase/hydolase n=1 Tax=Halobacillus litoralis TaxID=45668 RepID=UPI001CFC6E5D|nr:C45 family peptidase [Halobacillus litoralis]
MEWNINQYRGSSYHIGVSESLDVSEDILMKLKILENNRSPWEGIKQLQTFAPHIIEELQGVADGLGWSLKKTAARFAGCNLPCSLAMGCSSFIDKRFAVRNYDFSPDCYDHRLTLIQPDKAFASAGTSLHIVGRHEGVNEKGLFTALHFVNNKGAKEGFAATMIVRIVLDKCENTQQAITLLKKLPHAWNYNYSLSDQHGDMAVVEAGPERMRIIKGKGKITCTNHFKGSTVKEDFTRSIFRKQVMDQKNFTSITEAFHYFSDETSPLFYQDYLHSFGTLHTFGYDNMTGRVYIALPFGECVTIDWNCWVKGENVTQNRLYGRYLQKE